MIFWLKIRKPWCVCNLLVQGVKICSPVTQNYLSIPGDNGAEKKKNKKNPKPPTETRPWPGFLICGGCLGKELVMTQVWPDGSGSFLDTLTLLACLSRKDCECVASQTPVQQEKLFKVRCLPPFLLDKWESLPWSAIYRNNGAHEPCLAWFCDLGWWGDFVIWLFMFPRFIEDFGCIMPNWRGQWNYWNVNKVFTNEMKIVKYLNSR